MNPTLLIDRRWAKNSNHEWADRKSSLAKSDAGVVVYFLRGVFTPRDDSSHRNPKFGKTPQTMDSLQ